MSVQVARGSAAPAAAMAQRPTLPTREQLRQDPVHAVSQHTPGPVAESRTHCMLAHSPFAVHGWPFSNGPHLPFTQAIPAAQVVAMFAAVQVLAQVPETHLKLPHDCSSDGRQVPSPSHARVVFIAVVPAQVAAPQTVAGGYRVQVPNPSQMPVVPHVDGACVAHIACPCPAGVGMQVPSLPT